MVIVGLILIFISGSCNGVMDKLSFHYERSIFSSKNFNKHFWNPNLSWENKYKERGNSKFKNLIEKYDNGPLVLFTDAWHLFKSLMLSSLVIGSILYLQHDIFMNSITLSVIVDFIIIRSIYGLGFNLFFSHFLEKKHK